MSGQIPQTIFYIRVPAIKVKDLIKECVKYSQNVMIAYEGKVASAKSILGALSLGADKRWQIVFYDLEYDKANYLKNIEVINAIKNRWECE